MKNLYTIIVVLFITQFSFSQSVFINEINYTGDDTGVEIAGESGINLKNWKLYFYQGTNRKVYMTYSLSEIIPNLENNTGVIWFSISDISIGHPKGAGIALVNSEGDLVEFISYGGTFIAKDGPADNGIESIDIGIEEENVAIGKSLQKLGSKWIGPTDATPGILNSNKTLSVANNQIDGFKMYPNPATNGKLTISSNNRIDKFVEIYNMIGKQVYSKTISGNETIDISGLNAGLYLVRVKEEGKIVTKKLQVN